jgi:flagellar motor switch protein FliN
MPDSEFDGILSQDEIDAALSAASDAGSGSAPEHSSSYQADESNVMSSSHSAFDEVSSAARTAHVLQDSLGPAPSRFDIPELGQDENSAANSQAIELLRDVELDVKIELGRTRMLVDDVLRLNEGSVVELDKLAGDPVDVFVNNRLVARGEVLVLNDNFCVRISDIVARNEEGDPWQPQPQ